MKHPGFLFGIAVVVTKAAPARAAFAIHACSVVSAMSGGLQVGKPSQQNVPVWLRSSVQPATGGGGGGGGGLGLGGVGSGGVSGPSSIVAEILDSLAALATTFPSTSSIRPLPRL